MTDTLQVIAENTSVPAAGFTDGKHGRAMTIRWADRGKPVEKEKRTGDEIDRELSAKFGWAEVRDNESI